MALPPCRACLPVPQHPPLPRPDALALRAGPGLCERVVARVTGAVLAPVMAWALAIAAWPLVATSAPADTPAASTAPRTPHVLRYAMVSAETGFDPALASDQYSREVTDLIFAAPLRFDYLARPVQLRPDTAAALPEVSEDFREFTLRIRPGQFFADDPVFGGKPRELVAADVAYSLKRHFDPRIKSPFHTDLQGDDILGLEALRERAISSGRPFDYDAPLEGLQTPDRYTLRIRLGHAVPRFALRLAQVPVAGTLAREVCEAWGDAVAEHPVGTGPFKLTQWRRSSFIALDRNPGYREEVYDEHPPADDPQAQAAAAALKGRRLPLLDRVEISIIEEPQPRWLAFLGHDFDFIGVPYEFASLAVPAGRLAPHLAKRGIQLRKLVQPDVSYTYFNIEDPVVGGYDAAHVALRRAIALGYDNAEEARLLRRGLAVPAQGLVVPQVRGYDPGLVTGMSDFDPAKARALLDLYGWRDRNGDGWRDQPDGQPLVLTVAAQGDSTTRQFNALFLKRMAALGLRVQFERRPWPEQMKLARAGRLQMWMLATTASAPDAEDVLEAAYGPARGAGNYARFDLPEYNAVVARLQRLPDGPERDALMLQAQKLLVAWMPIKAHVHRIRPVLTQPWLIGYDGNPFVYGFARFVDVDPQRRATAGAR